MSNIPLLGPDGHGPVPNFPADLETIEQMQKNRRLFPKCKQIEEFKFKKKLNKSKTNFVAQVEDEEEGEDYVMKKIKYYKGDPELGISAKSLREVFILSRLSHPNIIGKEGIALENKMRGRNYILLEYCPENLVELLDSVKPLDQPEIKCFINMLVKGLQYLHDNLIVHRNICPNNILIHASGMLKIGDFGEARICTKIDDENNCLVGTAGYRAPELILGQKKYTRAIDMWSCGTVVGYILLGKSLFSSSSDDIDQMNDVIKLCGSPKENDIRNFFSHEFVLANFLKKCPDDKFNIVFQTYPDDLIDFMKSLLTYNENKRLKPEECLHHKYLNCEPLALDPSKILTRIQSKRKNRESDLLPQLFESVELAKRSVNTQPPVTSPLHSTSRNAESLSEGEIEGSSSESNSRDYYNRNYSTSRRR